MGKFLSDIANIATFRNGVNLIKGKYCDHTTMSGYDDNGKEARVAPPRVEFGTLESEGRPIALTFERHKNDVRMEYGFKVTTGYQDALPMKLSDLRLQFCYNDPEGGSPTKIDVNNPLMLWLRPQVAIEKKVWKFEEFRRLKQIIDEGDAYFAWQGIVQWLDVSDPKVKAQLESNDPKNEPVPNQVSLSGEIPINVTPNSDSYKSMYGKVNSMVNWEMVIIDSDHRIYFKDLVLHNEVNVLPQEYRVKALIDNRPEMSINVEPGEGTSCKAVFRFRFSPYMHPNTKRKLYGLYKQRSGKNYCGTRFGGYEKVEFEWGSDMKDGVLYGANGFVNLKGKDAKEDKENEGDFLITLESPEDGLIKWFLDKITKEEGLELGKVYFTVKMEGSKGNKRLDGIPVILDLRKLTAFSLDVTPVRNNKKTKGVNMPYYQADIVNPGTYPVEIGGVALSVHHLGKYIIKNAEHYLNCTNTWPQVLQPGQKITVELTRDQIETLKRKTPILKIEYDKGYWDRLICEPFNVRLLDNDLSSIVNKYNEEAIYQLDDWHLEVRSNFNWADYPTLTAIQVKLTHEYGLNTIITLDREQNKKTVNMLPNMNAKLKSQSSIKYKYCVGAVVQGHDDPIWGDVKEKTGGANDQSGLYISQIKNLIPQN